MIKKTITYADFNKNVVTEDFYFNLTQAEFLELEASEKGGVSSIIKEIVDSKDNALIVANFKKIILLSYGEKSSDGRRFVKNAEIRESFQTTEAYSQLFLSFLNDEKVGADFFNGLVPDNMRAEAKEAKEKRDASDARAASEANMQGHNSVVQRSSEILTVSEENPAEETAEARDFREFQEYKATQNI